MNASIEGLMSRSLVTVGPRMAVLDAARLATEKSIRHLLVMERRDLVGVLCVCDLHAARPGSNVGDCMATRVLTVTPETSLNDAAAIMRQWRVGSLPVMRRGSVVGILTRTDLLRAGFSEEMLGIQHCAACGYERNLKPDRHTPDVMFCLYCRERSIPPTELDAFELGEAG